MGVVAMLVNLQVMKMHVSSRWGMDLAERIGDTTLVHIFAA